MASGGFGSQSLFPPCGDYRVPLSSHDGRRAGERSLRVTIWISYGTDTVTPEPRALRFNKNEHHFSLTILMYATYLHPLAILTRGWPDPAASAPRSKQPRRAQYRESACWLSLLPHPLPHTNTPNHFHHHDDDDDDKSPSATGIWMKSRHEWRHVTMNQCMRVHRTPRTQSLVHARTRPALCDAFLSAVAVSWIHFRWSHQSLAHDHNWPTAEKPFCKTMDPSSILSSIPRSHPICLNQIYVFLDLNI